MNVTVKTNVTMLISALRAAAHSTFDTKASKLERSFEKEAEEKPTSQKQPELRL